MRKLPLLQSLFLSLLVVPTALLAIPGTPDHVPAASLIVPYFETGIDSSVNPHDTLLAVNNQSNTSRIIHYHVWDIDGFATTIQGNVTLAPSRTWSAAMRNLIAAASPAAKSQLTQGAFYRGFITIDGVSAATSLNPQLAGFPFLFVNFLEGYIYYTRLSEGSANGITMVPLEVVPAALDPLLRDFYNLGRREEIDASARLCADQLVQGTTPCTGNPDNLINRIQMRQFGSTPLSGKSRLVIFTWNTHLTGGPSARCQALGTCAQTYPYKRYREDGTLVADLTFRFDHVVNLIDISGTPDSGWVSIWNIPDPDNDWQIYAYSFNSAQPGSSSLNWDAIFTGYIVP